MTYPEGDGPDDDNDEAVKKAKLERDKPEHKRHLGHPDDEATRDDRLDDPAKQKPD